MIKWKSVSLTLLSVGIPFFISAQQPYPLTIEQMFALADQNSRAIRAYAIAEREAEQAVRVARNDRLPSLELSASASYLGDGWLADRNFSNGMNAPMPHFGNNFAVEASQVVYAGGAISSSVAMAKLRYQLAQLDTERNRQEIRMLLIGHYLELCKLNNQSRVFAKNIEQTHHLLDDIRAKHSEGLAIKNDVTRYELQLQRLELALTQVENTKVIINDQLVTTLGLGEETLIIPDTEAVENLPGILAEKEWQLRASDNSPALKQAQIGVKHSEYGVKLARSERIPSFALFAADHLDGPITIEVPPINKNFNYWYVGIGLKFNIASLYKSGKSIQRAKYAVERASEQERLLRENIHTDVKSAYVRFTEAFTTCEMFEKSLELATDNYSVVENRYLNGLALITDMLDASNTKLGAELDVANARINILFNYYKLKKSAGDL